MSDLDRPMHRWPPVIWANQSLTSLLICLSSVVSSGAAPQLCQAWKRKAEYENDQYSSNIHRNPLQCRWCFYISQHFITDWFLLPNLPKKQFSSFQRLMFSELQSVQSQPGHASQPASQPARLDSRGQHWDLLSSYLTEILILTMTIEIYHNWQGHKPN